MVTTKNILSNSFFVSDMDGSWHGWLLVGKFQCKAPLNDGGGVEGFLLTHPPPNLTPFLCKFFNLPWKPSRFLNGLDNKAKWLSRDCPSSSHNPCYEKRHFQGVGKDKLCHQHSNIVYPQSFWRIVRKKTVSSILVANYSNFHYHLKMRDQ